MNPSALYLHRPNSSNTVIPESVTLQPVPITHITPLEPKNMSPSSSDLRRTRTTPMPSSRIRRVSISELPVLSRASTFDIEVHYAKLHLRYRRKQIARVMKEKRGDMRQVLKRGAALLALLPLKPCVRFSDDVEAKARELIDCF
ncbi:hypothetical protein GGR55DRAFT_663270 [Xylaria sp. FL0064]|nr:hypothetical protein GGR55DRAFT_663270 [Xylaria sp. FL0064]